MNNLRRRWFERFIQAALARPWWVLAFFTALGLGGALLSMRLEFRGSFVELLPEGAREVQDLTRVSQKAGGDGYLVLRAQGASPEQLQAYAQELQGTLEKLPDVRYVEHRFDVGFFLHNGLLLMPAERLHSLYTDFSARLSYEKQQLNQLYVELEDTPAPPTFEEIQHKYVPESPVKENLA